MLIFQQRYGRYEFCEKTNFLTFVLSEVNSCKYDLFNMKSRFFNPRIGKLYAQGLINGKKVLVLGASHYCQCNGQSGRFNCPVWKECTSKEIRDSSKFNTCCPAYVNNGWIQEYGVKLEDSSLIEIDNYFDTPSSYYTYSNFTNFIIDYFGLKSPEEVWDRLAFANYVQYFLPTPKTPAFDEKDIRNFEAFLQTLQELKPDVVIVWGTKTRDHFKKPYIQSMVDKLTMRENDYYWDLEYQGQPYILVNCWHPSDYFRWSGSLDNFYDALKEVL